MKKMKIQLLVIVLLLAGLACNLPGQVVDALQYTPTPLPPEQQPENPPQEPTATLIAPDPLVPAETATATLPPPPPAAPIGLFPVGFVTALADGGGVTFHDLNGVAQGVVALPGASTGPGTYIHFAGPYAGNPQNMPIVFQTFENMGDLKQSLGGQVSTLVAGPDVAYIKGAAAQNALVYAVITWGEALTTHFYARSAQGGGASWFWERVDPNGYAMYPLGVAAENNEIQTVFYTHMPWGIGGDIVFPPYQGLFRLNMEHLEQVLLLTEDFTPMGISTDNAMVAYTEQNNVADPNTRVTIYTLEGGLGLPVNLAPGSDRGAGYAVFSPDNRYVAWMEGSGWMMAETPNFHSRVRIVDTNTGAILADLADSTLAALTVDPAATWVQPVGWLDAENLLVEVRGADWGQTALVRVRFDGTKPSYVTTGMFVDFLYP